MPLLGILGLLVVNIRLYPTAEWAFLVALVTLLSTAVHQLLNKSAFLLLIFNGSSRVRRRP